MFPGWEFEVVVISTHFTHERNRQRDGLSQSCCGGGQISSQGFQNWPLYNLGQHIPSLTENRSTYNLQRLRLLAPTRTEISWPEKAQMQLELHCKPSALRETVWLLVCRQTSPTSSWQTAPVASLQPAHKVTSTPRLRGAPSTTLTF